MIKAKFNPFVLWTPPIILAVVSGFAIAVLIDDPNTNDIVPVVMVWAILTIILLPLILSIKGVTADPFTQTIVFTRFYKRQSRSYNYADFDGYVDMIIKPGRGGSYPVLYLIKGGRLAEVLSGRTYANLDEIEEGISGIPYLGEIRSTLLIHLKKLLGFKVL